MTAPLFPIFLDLAQRSCLVVGSGPEAVAKEEMLQRCGAEVLCVERFHPDLLAGTALVIVAGAPLTVAEVVARAARLRGIPINVVDEPRLCSFIMPSVIDRAPVIVAISTGGTAPAFSRLLRLALDRALPARLGDLAALAGRFRALARAQLPQSEARRLFWEKIFTGRVAELALSGDPEAAAALGAALAEEKAAAEKPAAVPRDAA